MSQINLRGLGANQTLILVDGHRTAKSVDDQWSPQQSGFEWYSIGGSGNGSKWLPTTASGIYGRPVRQGGVINVILRPWTTLARSSSSTTTNTFLIAISASPFN